MIDGSVLRLDDIHTEAESIRIRWGVDDRNFETVLRYADLSLPELVDRIGISTWNRIAFHIALFELSKGLNLRPVRLELGDWAHHFTHDVAAVWRRVLTGVFAQWRWEHDDPNAPVPMPPRRHAPTPAPARRLGDIELLAFCGGGKDSLVGAHLLERSGLHWSAFVYSHSAYGDHEQQWKLAEGLLSHLSPTRIHRVEIDDTFFEAGPSSDSARPEVAEPVVAETPCSVMAALPVVVDRGYRHIVLGHERSANFANLEWEETGESVNHQWGKSRTAEKLLTEYIDRALCERFSCFGILQPLHDPVIFASLNHVAEAVPVTHSCNREKPWCMKCPKCVYVWLGYKAWLPDDIVRATFGNANPLVDPDTRRTISELLGLTGQLPFECVGQVPESRLLVRLIAAHSPRTPGVMRLVDRFEATGTDIRDLLSVHDELDAPDAIRRPLLRVLGRYADSARRHAYEVLDELR